MQPEGIHVQEIDLNLPDACYYLCWTPDVPPESGRAHRTIRQAVLSAGAELGWRILSYAVCPRTGVIHLLFRTTAANLDTGLSRLLRGAAGHRLFLVQAETAARQVARHIRRAVRTGEAPANDAAAAELPEARYGLFMGSSDWADDILDGLSRRERAPDASRCRSLAEIARHCPGRQQAIVEAYRGDHFSLKDIAEFFDMHFSEVSAVINGSVARNDKRTM